MPKKALVAFAVVLGLGLALPAWSSPVISRPGDAMPETEGEAAGPVAKSSPLTLDAALMRALEYSPKLSVFTHEVRAREFETHQAGVRPNPELSVEVENVAGSGEFTGTGAIETTVRISRLVETGGKRARRQDVGRMDQELAERKYEIARAEVLAETRAGFVSVLAAQTKLSLAKEQAALAERVLQTVEDRVTAGKTASIEKVRFQILVAEARLRQDKARQEYSAVRQILAAVWGSEEVDFESVQGDLEKVPAIRSWAELVSGLDQSPEAALRNSEARRADRLLALERANRIPDLTLSLGARNDQNTGDNALVAEFSVPLPIFDRNRGGVGAAGARRAKAMEAERTALLQLRAELAEAWQKALSAQSEVVMLREEILPASRETFDAVIYGYQAGKFGFLEVLDAERALFNARIRYVDSLTDLHRSIADLERLLGRKIASDEDYILYPGKERGQS